MVNVSRTPEIWEIHKIVLAASTRSHHVPTGSFVLDCFDSGGQAGWLQYTGLESVTQDYKSLSTWPSKGFAIYVHQLCRINDKPNYGWLRNMFQARSSFSKSCVSTSQDPKYYMLYVALREDHNINLVSYPYYAHFQKEGDSPAFRHIDINIENPLAQKVSQAGVEDSTVFYEYWDTFHRGGRYELAQRTFR